MFPFPGSITEEDSETLPISYLYDEEIYFRELTNHINQTYLEHYSSDPGEIQAFQVMSKRPQRALHFAVMSILKYSDRFGEKEGENRKDLLKIAHFALLALYALDKKTKRKTDET